MKLLLFHSLIFFHVAVFAQNNKISWLEKDTTFKIEPYFMFQWWNTYSYNMQIDADSDGVFEPVESRFNTMIRRARLGFKANPYPGLKLRLVTFYDGVGIDALSAAAGSPNNGSVEWGIWDAYLQWQPFKDEEALNLVAGYFRPQLGRESITSAFATTSGEKALQQSYIRNHLVGVSNGRASGLNIGGLVQLKNSIFGLNYNVGVFNPVYNSGISNTAGIEWSPLLVGRSVIYLGDPEMNDYKIGYLSNYYNQRRGISLGLGGAWQGSTNLFEESTTTSLDLLLNWDKLNLDVDWHFLGRQGYLDRQMVNYNFETGHIRSSYNIIVADKIIEPVLMLVVLQAGESPEEKQEAEALGTFSGTEEYINLGLNYYLNKHKLKVIAHYIQQDGTSGNNIYSNQSGIDVPIRRGDYFMVGLNVVF